MNYIETEKVELKKNLNETFEKEVVAFLNTHDGVIYIGVENKGEVCGIDISILDNTMKKISDVITTGILPNPQELINVVARYEGRKYVIEVTVKKGHSLYYIKKYGRSSKGCYIRVGTSCRSMTEEQINNRFIESINIPKYSLVDEVSPRQDLSFRVLRIYLDSHDVYYNEENFAVNNYLLTKDGKYNYQAFILSDQNNLSYKLAQWEGPTKQSKYLFKKEFGNCSVLKSIDDLNSYIKSTHNIVRSFFDIGNTARRDEYLIDQEAFREEWINACLHNDYSRHLGPAVYLFSDHLEIFSYGNPLTVQTKDDFLRGVSVPINPELTNIFMKIDKTEASGKGVNTIVKKYGIDVFEFSETHLTIKIPYNVKALESTQETEKDQSVTQENTQEIGKDQKITQEITQEIGKDQRITQEITQETGKDQSIAQENTQEIV